MRHIIQGIILSSFFMGTAWAQYSTPVRIVEQPVETQSSREVVNLVEQTVLSSGAVVTSPTDLITVPAGSRLVITAVAVDTGLNTCSYSLNPRIRISRPSSPSLVMFPLGRASSSVFGSSTVSYVNQATYPVTIFAEPGDVVRFDLFRSNTNCTSIVRLSISGYLEDNL